ncbi:serine hydrolase domain-containing protein [Kitasatospora kifunensis]|uniref:CubicO group peptidase (Beta-lactamase class C family) n=1 Tax=Kitasatospora kifunensis TaxID=58351 RepID=A0A7W7VYK0_KITKI|nr:serine hydrolase domain-containing protein [Kitasatospora kifunensis]MBB4926730.1 CubicO group peptidase (beta-lactamase class C family) [Kitasatospora kifunensis]
MIPTGHSKGFVKARLDQMHAALAQHVGPDAVPGLVALVARDDEVHVEAIGDRAVDGAPVARDTVFRVASMTKAVTAVAALMLVEECRLRLDDPVDELLPELANRRVLRRVDGPLDDTVPAHRPITVRDLLTFTMGTGLLLVPPDSYPILQAMTVLDLGQGTPRPGIPPEPDEWLPRLGTLPLMHQPGERWLYNTGSDVLGVLVARASGQPFEQFLRERLFEPLGMGSTGFSVAPDRLARFTTCYWTDPTTGERVVYDEAAGGEWATPPAFPSGAAGLVSTVDDFLAFSRMLLDGGRLDGERILSRASVALLSSDQLTPEQKAASGLSPDFFATHGWGYGVRVVTRQTEIGHPVHQYGWNGGLGSSWAIDPVDRVIGIILTSRAFTSPTAPPVVQDFWTSAYQALAD